ncbi:MAG: DUF4149 domain-containing protein [Mariprofundus sp.]|nr:DUF4149 domain-containing protein [Mariprofundus sp.]
MTVACIRIGAVRLCLALMLGLLVVSGYVVAPVLFANAGSSTLAGALAGDVFHVANRGIIFLAVAVMVFWFRMRKSGLEIGRLRWILLLLVTALIAGNEFAIAPIIAELKSHIASFDALAADDPQRQLFGVWHGVSAIIHLLASICAAVLVALGATRPVQYEELEKPTEPEQAAQATEQA